MKPATSLGVEGTYRCCEHDGRDSLGLYGPDGQVRASHQAKGVGTVATMNIIENDFYIVSSSMTYSLVSTGNTKSASLVVCAV